MPGTINEPASRAAAQIWLMVAPSGRCNIWITVACAVHGEGLALTLALSRCFAAPCFFCARLVSAAAGGGIQPPGRGEWPPASVVRPRTS